MCVLRKPRKVAKRKGEIIIEILESCWMIFEFIHGRFLFVNLKFRLGGLWRQRGASSGRRTAKEEDVCGWKNEKCCTKGNLQLIYGGRPERLIYKL